MDTSELINIIINNEIVIYGAGYAARNFYTALKLRNLNKRVKCFAVTDLKKAPEEIQGIPVMEVKSMLHEKNIYFCIAVHESIKNELEEYLLKSDVEQYVWVHPNIMEIALGNLLAHHKPVEVRSIIRQHCHDNYALAIRYLAIDEFYKKNNIGYDVYLKALHLQCEDKTARRRLNAFIKLIDDWDRSGYRQERAILIDESNRLVDGTHRLSLACYHKTEYIYCDIFPCSDNYEKMVKENHFLNMDILKKSGFSLFEIESLESVQKKIQEKFHIDENQEGGLKRPAVEGENNGKT